MSIFHHQNDCGGVRRTPRGFFVILGFLAFAVLFCGKEQGKKKSEATEVGYQIIKLKSRTLKDPIKVLGSVSFFKKAEITSKVLGRVQYLYAEEGDAVRTGQVLARIETINLYIQLRKDQAALDVQRRKVKLAEAKYILAKQRVEKEMASIETARADQNDAFARLKNLRRLYSNKKKLHKIGGVSETELKAVYTQLVSAETSYFKAQTNLNTQTIGYRKEDLVKAGMKAPSDKSKLKDSFIDLNTIIEKNELSMAVGNQKALQASVDSTRLLIRESYIRSPIHGIIASRAIERGEAVKENNPLFIVVDTARILIKYAVSETDSVYVKKGQEVRFRIDALRDRKYQGKVYLINPLVDPASRTVEIKVVADNKSGELKPGMFSRGEIFPSQGTKLFLISAKSVIRKGTEKKGFVFFVNKKGLLFKKEVRLGITRGDEIEIRGDFKEGDSVAVGDIRTIQEGQKAVIKADPAAGSKTGKKPGATLNKKGPNKTKGKPAKKR